MLTTIYCARLAKAKNEPISGLMAFFRNFEKYFCHFKAKIHKIKICIEFKEESSNNEKEKG